MVMDLDLNQTALVEVVALVGEETTVIPMTNHLDLGVENLLDQVLPNSR